MAASPRRSRPTRSAPSRPGSRRSRCRRPAPRAALDAARCRSPAAASPTPRQPAPAPAARRVKAARASLIGLGVVALIVARARRSRRLAQRARRRPRSRRDGRGAAPAADPALVARGEYLVRAGDCGGCHTERGGEPFAGGRAHRDAVRQRLRPNLTPDRRPGSAPGLTTSSGAPCITVARATGGSSIPCSRIRTTPAFRATMPTRCSRTCRACRPSPRRTAPTRSAFPSTPRPRSRSGERSTSVRRRIATTRRRPPEWNRGAYLVEGLGHCNACHSARNALGATAGTLDLQGGLIPVQNWYAPSLASPHEAGVAAGREPRSFAC